MKKTLLALLLACMSCGKGGGTLPDGPRCDGMTAGQAFVTYNTAWGPGMVSMASLRGPAIVDALRVGAYDVACLQEVWSPVYARSIQDGLQLTEKQTFYSDATGLRENGRDLCKEDQLTALEACAAKECGDAKATEEVSICVKDKCASNLFGIYRGPDGPACINCLVAMAGKSVEDTRSTCVGEGQSRIQGGASGAMLIAKTGRLYNKEPMLLNSSGSNRTALFATLRMNDTFGTEKEIEVACTHISASAAIAPSHSGYLTWDDEKRAQIDAIVEKLGERATRADGTVVPMVFMGDFNAGPDSDTAVFSEVTSAGFTCPTAASVTGGGCSSCDDNTFHKGSGSGGTMIDHVCILNPAKGDSLVPTCTDRLFDTTVTIKGYDGKADVTTHPSDHYAKRALFDLKSSGPPL